MDVISLVVNNSVIIIIALLTYHYIDRKSVIRQKNQEKIAKRLIKTVYDSCKENVDLLDDKWVEQLIIKKTDFDKPITDTDPTVKLENYAFTNEHIIMDAFQDGILSVELFNQYIEVKNAYKKYMNYRITFFDVPNLYNPLRQDFEDKYLQGKSSLEID